jgi:hypothetical protein
MSSRRATFASVDCGEGETPHELLPTRQERRRNGFVVGLERCRCGSLYKNLAYLHDRFREIYRIAIVPIWDL